MNNLWRRTGDIQTMAWHIWYDRDTWSVSEFRSEPMSDALRHLECARMQLRHYKGYEIAVMFVKVQRGMNATARTLQFGLSDRRAVVDAAFRFLAKPQNCPALVVGDLGVGLPRCMLMIATTRCRAFCNHIASISEDSMLSPRAPNLSIGAQLSTQTFRECCKLNATMATRILLLKQHLSTNLLH